MAASTNGGGNLVDEFEESFQACLNVLTKQEATPYVEKEEVKIEIERFVDLARQMEAFFLQKRFLLSALKPEFLVKEDNNELKCELQRKDELLKRHYDKIGMWQSLLADLQGYAKSQQASASASTPAAPTTPNPAQQPTCSMQQSAMQASQISNAVHMQQQAGGVPGPATAAAMQQQMGGAGGMYMQGARTGYQNSPLPPLAYLEKASSNIDMVGMGDGRR